MGEWWKPLVSALVTGALTYFGLAQPQIASQQSACDEAILYLIEEAREG